MATISGWAPFRVAVLLTALLGLPGWAAASASATDAGSALPPVTRLAAVVQPVVQSITTEYHGKVIIEDPVDNKAALRQLQELLWAQQRSGKLARDWQSANRWWLSMWADYANRYSKPAKRRVVEVSVKGLCSGWFATPDGYLVTGAHCVTMSRAAQLEAFKAKLLPALIEKDYKNSLKHFRGPLDQGMLRDMRRIPEVFYDDHTKLASTTTTVEVELAVKGKTLERDTKSVPAEVVSVGKAYPGRDVALLKVNGYQNLPSLALGDEKHLQVGDPLFVSGFPGTVAGNTDFSVTSRKEPTFTEGLLNASRVTAKGVPYLQTQAPATHGNSGGPVLDASGKVIGILIAGSIDQNTGDLVAGQQFVLPASEVLRELAGHALKATSDPVTTPYAAALSDYSRGYYKRSLVGFSRVQEMFPSHPYAAHYASLARQRISAGDDRTPGQFPVKRAAAGLVAVVLILAVSVLVVRRRRRAADAAGTGTAPAEPIPTGATPTGPTPAGTVPVEPTPADTTPMGTIPAAPTPAGTDTGFSPP